MAVRAFLEYVQLCAKRNVKHESLDECLVGWGRWCIRVEEMETSEEAREACLAKKKEIAGEETKVGNMPAASFVTYVGNMARVYRQVA